MDVILINPCSQLTLVMVFQTKPKPKPDNCPLTDRQKQIG